jgi:hypothetical protein
MYMSFMKQTKIEDCTVKLKRINYPNKPEKEPKFWVSVVGNDPITQKRKKIWSLSGENKGELWEKAKKYAEKYAY